MNKLRFPDIDRAKGLAIILVVLGHIAAKEVPQGNEWYNILEYNILIRFHTQFFMFLSGLVAFYFFKPISTFSEYGTYIWKKVVRLAPPYFLFSVAVVIIKLLTQQHIHVLNTVDSINDLNNIIIDPWASSSRYLWYIYVLLEFYIILPLLMKLTRRIELFLPIAFVLHFLFFSPESSLFAYKQFVWHFPAFLLGGCAAIYYKQYTKIIDQGFYLFLFLFSACLGIAIYESVPAIVMGVLSIPALHGLVRRPWCERFNFLETLGKYSFPIYMMNTIVIGIIKSVTLKFVSWDGSHFMWIGPLLFLSGLYLPVLIKRFGFSHIPVLDRVTT
jgi:fucose 4-O-acetylase-like acetyltransferase